MRPQAPEIKKMSLEELRAEVLKLREESARKDAVVDEANKQMHIFWEINNQLRIKNVDLEKKLVAANTQLVKLNFALSMNEEQLTDAINELIERRNQTAFSEQTSPENGSPLFRSIARNVPITSQSEFIALHYEDVEIVRLQQEVEWLQTGILDLKIQEIKNRWATGELENDLREAREEAKTLNADKASKKNEILELHQSMSKLTEELQRQQAKNNLLQAENESLRVSLNKKTTSKEIASSRRTAENLDRQLNRAQSDNKYLKEQINKLKEENGRLKKQALSFRWLEKPALGLRRLSIFAHDTLPDVIVSPSSSGTP